MEDLKEATTAKDNYLVQAADQPLEFSSCTMSQDTLERWQVFFDTYTKSWSALQGIRHKSLTPPVPPDLDEVERLEDLPWDAEKVPEARPEWLSPASHLREELFPFGLRLTEASGQQTCVKFLYAKLNCPVCQFLILHQAEPLDEDFRDDGQQWIEALHNDFTHCNCGIRGRV